MIINIMHVLLAYGLIMFIICLSNLYSNRTSASLHGHVSSTSLGQIKEPSASNHENMLEVSHTMSGELSETPLTLTPLTPISTKTITESTQIEKENADIIYLRKKITEAIKKERCDKLRTSLRGKGYRDSDIDDIISNNKMPCNGGTPARESDYIAWFKGHLLSGKHPTHVYDYSLSRSIDSWVIVNEDFKIYPLYGANQRHYILNSGCKFLGGNRGHSSIHFMDDFTCIGDYAPLYSDITFWEK